MHVFRVPAAVFVAGSSQSGKTTLIRGILRQLDKMTDKPITRILYYYTIESKNLPRDMPGVELRQGIPDPEELMAIPGYKCVILDDALTMFDGKNKELVDLFTKVVSHTGTLLFIVVQSLFKLDRTARANSQYILLTRCSSDKLQIRTLAHQCFPENPKYFIESVEDAVYSKPYGHILIDTHPLTPRHESLVSDILEPEHSAYIRKDLVKSLNI